MKLSIVVPMLGQHALTRFMIGKLLENITNPETRITVIDNGGDFTLDLPDEHKARVDLFRPMKDLDTFTPSPRNIGVYEAFRCGMTITEAEIVAFFHSDLIVVEKGFDDTILLNFEQHPETGLIGFVGSNEIDYNGGRGLGTTSNFQGRTYYSRPISEWVECNSHECPDNPPFDGDKQVPSMVHCHPPLDSQEWRGSPAEAHGMRNSGYTNAAVVDGCAMVLRRSMWEQLEFKEDWPPHHFYDRLIATQMLEKGFKVGVLGIACDHISGQTVAKEERYNDLAKEWCQKHGIAPTHNYDDAIYREAEKRWLYEYRQVKGIVPVKV